jgi:hypothetical protein
MQTPLHTGRVICHQSGGQRFHRRNQRGVDRVICVQHCRKGMLLRLVGVPAKLFCLSGFHPTQRFLPGTCQRPLNLRIHSPAFGLAFGTSNRCPASNLLQFRFNGPVNVLSGIRKHIPAVSNLPDHFGQPIINGLAKLVRNVSHSDSCSAACRDVDPQNNRRAGYASIFQSKA